MADAVEASENNVVYDVVVVGGGMVGSAVAVGLAQIGITVAVIESQPPTPFDSTSQPDIRLSAISVASQRLLTKLGAWSYIEAMRVHPYQRLATWEDNEGCEFSADELGLSELGFFVENRILQLGLHQRAKDLSGLDIIFSNIKSANTKAASSQSPYSDKPCKFELANGQTIYSKWAVGADGGRSYMRANASIGTTSWSYHQQVLAILVKAEHTDTSITWQAFSPSGPMSYLPLFDGYAELIWYYNAEQVAKLKAFSHDELAGEVKTYFPDRLGDIQVLDRASFPIQRMHAQNYYRDNLVLVGDAAHCINPLAGQGVNLGFKDVSVLLELAQTYEDDVLSLFKTYEKKRRKDNLLMMSVMDGLYATFSNNITPIRLIRNLGLCIANRVPFAKKQALSYALGLSSLE